MSDQSDAAQKILQLACRGPLRLDDVMAEIAPIVQERDEILERLSECSKEMCLWNRKCEDARVERDAARSERDTAKAWASVEEVTRLRILAEHNREQWAASNTARDTAQARVARLETALRYYAAAPWVGHAGSWANSNLAEVADAALSDPAPSGAPPASQQP